jgi:hypothetical protein
MGWNRTYKNFEIVETDSGYGARPKGTDTTIGLAGTLQGYKSLRAIRDAINEQHLLYAEMVASDPAFRA